MKKVLTIVFNEDTNQFRVDHFSVDKDVMGESAYASSDHTINELDMTQTCQSFIDVYEAEKIYDVERAIKLFVEVYTDETELEIETIAKSFNCEIVKVYPRDGGINGTNDFIFKGLKADLWKFHTEFYHVSDDAKDQQYTFDGALIK